MNHVCDASKSDQLQDSFPQKIFVAAFRLFLSSLFFEMRQFIISRKLQPLLGSKQRARQQCRGCSFTASSAADFEHHAAGVARLNHASFGAVPAPVLAVQESFRQQWLAQPDELYFSGRLHRVLREAAAAGATTLLTKTTTEHEPFQNQFCLLENATVACKLMSPLAHYQTQ